MMRFNVPIELAKWNQIDNFSVELRRDMSKQRIYDLKADELPQFGEGSEYKAREKEIARKDFEAAIARLKFLFGHEED